MPETATVTLTNIRIWDGAAHVDADTLQMTGGHISFLGSREDAAPSRAQIDCAGLTAIPGLIDAHVHLELNPDHKDPPQRTEGCLTPSCGEAENQ